MRTMGTLKRIVTALAVAALCAISAAGASAQATDGARIDDSARMDELFRRLAEAEGPAAKMVEAEIWSEWSRSGSIAMDLLLERGREAMTKGETQRAIEHFTALIDHAPDFAEAYNARATAYYQANLYGPSLEDIRQALALNPRHFGAMSGLALILEELGYEAEALEVYRELAKIHPHREGLAEALERLGRAVEGDAL